MEPKFNIKKWYEEQIKGCEKLEKGDVNTIIKDEKYIFVKYDESFIDIQTKGYGKKIQYYQYRTGNPKLDFRKFSKGIIKDFHLQYDICEDTFQLFYAVKDYSKIISLISLIPVIPVMWVFAFSNSIRNKKLKYIIFNSVSVLLSSGLWFLYLVTHVVRLMGA